MREAFFTSRCMGEKNKGGEGEERRKIADKVTLL